MPDLKPQKKVLGSWFLVLGLDQQLTTNNQQPISREEKI
jgi:hypothetical protein